MNRLHDWRRAAASLGFLACCAAPGLACGTEGTTSSPDAASAKDGTSGPDGGVDGSSPDSSSDGSSGDAGGGDVSSGTLLQPRPLRFEEDLRGVWGSSPSDVWLVGGKGRILHWNGLTLAPREAGTGKDLFAVWGRSSSDVYFAGDAVVLHWDGHALADVTPKSPAGAVYRSVHASPDGSTLVVAGDKGVVQRRNSDGTWKEEATGSSLDIQSIAATDTGIVWAVGTQGQALKLSGGSWSATAMPKASAKTLRAVTAGPTGRLFAAGDAGYLAVTDQGTWTATLANDEQNRDLHALWAPTDDEAWAIGKKGVLMHYFGKKWLQEDMAGTYMKTASFNGLWGNTGPKEGRVAFAVGDGGAGLVLTPPTCQGQPTCAADATWQDFRAETVADVRSVAATASGVVFACGQAGLLLRAADANAPLYDLAAPVTAADLNDVTAVGEDPWAVGAGGTVVFRNAQGVLTSEVIPGGKDLFGVAPLGSDQVVAVGDGGVVAVRGKDPAATWTLETSVTQLPLRSVATVDKEAFAVGDFGTIVHRDAAGKWSAEDSGQVIHLTRVFAAGSDVVAVGETGLILVRQAGAWKVAFQAPLGNLYGVTQRKDGTIVAVGYGGTIVVGKPGGTFKKLDGGPSWLLDVVATPAGTLAVGKKGSAFLIPEALP